MVLEISTIDPHNKTNMSYYNSIDLVQEPCTSLNECHQLHRRMLQ